MSYDINIFTLTRYSTDIIFVLGQTGYFTIDYLGIALLRNVLPMSMVLAPSVTMMASSGREF